MIKRKITWSEIKEKVKILPKGKYFGVPRGGQYIAALLNPVDTAEEADFIIDDLIDSGRTKERYKQLYPGKPFFALYEKGDGEKEWLIFPWEIEDEGKEIEDYLIRIAQYMNIKIEIKK